MKKWIIILCGFILSCCLGFVCSSYSSKISLGPIEDYSFDKQGNLILLHHTENDFSLYKISSENKLIYQKSIPLEDEGLLYKYQQIETDDEGNIAVLLYAVDPKEGNNIKIEKIVLYNALGEYIRELARVEWQDEVRKDPYFFNMRMIGSTLNFFGNKDGMWDHYTIDTSKPEEPILVQSFKLATEPNCTYDFNWVRQWTMVATSDGRIIYATQSGRIFMMDQQKVFQDLTYRIGEYVSATNITIDDKDNIYIRDTLTYEFYSYNPNTDEIKQLFKSDSKISDELYFYDLLDVTYVNDNSKMIFSAVSSDGMQFVCFGDENLIIKDVSKQFYPSIFWGTVIFTIIIFLAFLIIVFIVYKARKRLPLIQKIFLLFFPVLFVSICIIVMTTFSNVYLRYVKNKLMSQSGIAATIAESIEADKMSSIKIQNYKSEEYNEFAHEFYVTLTNLNSILYTFDYVNLYTVEDGTIYLSMDAYENERDANYIYQYFVETYDMEFAVSKVSQGDRLYDIFSAMNNHLLTKSEVEPKLYMYDRVKHNVNGDWINVFYPIRDSEGEIVGMVEVTKNADEYRQVFEQFMQFFLISLIIANIILFVYLFFVLKFIFRPLERLRQSVSTIGDGIWNTKVQVTTRDEIGDVGTAFNLMSDRIHQYVSSITILNRVSQKFLPKDLLEVMKKGKITDVKLYDKVEMNCNLLLINFFQTTEEIKKRGLPEKFYFDQLNVNFNAIHKIVSRNSGIIDSYDGRGMRILFPKNATDALNATLQLREKFSEGRVKFSKINTVLASGPMLIGIAGNEARYSVVALSDIVLASYYILDEIDKIGVDYVMEEGMVNQLSKLKNLHYRYIGKVRCLFNNSSIALYEMFNIKDVHEKNLYITTKKLFEYGVESYLRADLYNARRAFSNVLGINEEDKLAMYYLALCNKNSNFTKDGWEGFLF